MIIDHSQNTCLRMMVLCSVLWSRRVAGPGWIFCPKKQQNKYTRWKVKVVEKHKREKCTNSGTFPWQKSGEAEGGLDLGDKLCFPSGDKQYRRGGISALSIVQAIQMKQCCQNVVWSNYLPH